MFRALSHLPAVTGIVLFVVVPSLVSAIAAVLVRRKKSIQLLRENNEFAAITYPIVGLFYGVFLAFAIVIVWQRFTDAEDSAYREVSALSELWRDVEVFPEADRARIQSRMREYVTAVVEQEWPAMARPDADRVRDDRYDALWKAFYALEPRSENEKAFLTRSLEELDNVGAARRLRLTFSASEMPLMLWAFLLFGAAVTIMFSYFLGTKHSLTHALTSAALTSIIGFSLLLIMDMQYPFDGPISVEPTPYRDLLRIFSAR